MNAVIPTQLPICQIKVGERIRKHLGNVKSLAKSIDEIGLLHPLVVDINRNLIAGRRRLEACKLLGWTEVPVHLVDLASVMRGEQAENLARENFRPSEIVALKRAIESSERLAAKQRQGTRTDRNIMSKLDTEFGKSRDSISRRLGTSHVTLTKFEVVVKAAEDEPENEKYRALVEHMDRTGKASYAHRQLMIAKRRAEIDNMPPGLPEGPFSVIVADPPWRYENGDLEYPMMDLESIKAKPVGKLADKDAILWLWTTNTHLRAAFEVVEAWGFEYKTLLTWFKDNGGSGTGTWLCGQTEHCLLAARGKPAFQFTSGETTALWAKGNQAGEHSKKPDEFYALVERLCGGSKVELFARRKRPGWEPWGSEVAAKASFVLNH